MTEENMQQPPESQQPQGDSFGFAAQPKSEKYNTEFLVANLEADKKRTKLIVLAVFVAVLGAVGILIAVGTGGDKPLPKATPEHAAPAAPRPAATNEPVPPPAVPPTQH